jgi:hypothetical protein
MMATVPMKVSVEPMAPKIPSRLFQNPNNSSAPKVHSETPRNQLAPRTPNTGYSQKISGPLLMNEWDQDLRLISESLLVPKARKISTIDARMRW